MILSDDEITKRIANGNIVVTPWDPDKLGPNSYDVHLANTLMIYRDSYREGHEVGIANDVIDAAKMNDVDERVIGPEGYVLHPGRLYLASTLEYTEAHDCLPYLDGKSAVGRLGIRIHATAGRGDVGFCGHWTMEIDVVQKVRIYAGMPIAQLTWHTVRGKINRPYGKGKANVGKYGNTDPKPQASRMWKHFLPKEES